MRLLLGAALLSLFSFNAYADIREMDDWEACIHKTSAEESFIKACNKERIEESRKELKIALQNYARLIPIDKKAKLNDAQKKWAEYRNNFCDTHSYVIDTQMCWFLLEGHQAIIIQTIADLVENEDMLGVHIDRQRKETSKAVNKGGGDNWYKSVAEPSLSVRNSPSVSGQRLDSIPTNGKIRIINWTGKKDFIGGREGEWVKVEWKSSTGYVFDAHLAPVSE